jgi:hypothetical protein
LILRLTAEPPRPGREVLDQVEDIWLGQRAEFPGLFNGDLFSLDRFEGREALGWACPYKWFVAQLAEPLLRRHLRVRSLAVSGLCLAGDRLVFGLRNPSLFLDPGLWELAPSGGIPCSSLEPDGTLSYSHQFYRELREELGIVPAQATAIEPFVIVEDTATNIWDMGLALELPLEPDEVARLHRERGSDEYTALEMVPAHEAGAFLAGRQGRVSGVSRALLEARGLLAGD